MLTTQNIHELLNHRAGRDIPIKHLMILMDTYGKPIDEDTIADFLTYAW